MIYDDIFGEKTIIIIYNHTSRKILLKVSISEDWLKLLDQNNVTFFIKLLTLEICFHSSDITFLDNGRVSTCILILCKIINL